MADTAADRSVYQYLARRPESWRRQLYLKGHNISVGQLIASMNIEEMTPEIAADRMDLPVEQIREAIAYYEANKDLVESEFLEEKRWLQMRGFALESPTVS